VVLDQDPTGALYPLLASVEGSPMRSTMNIVDHNTDPLPNLDVLLANPDSVHGLSVTVCQRLLIQVGSLQTVLLSRLLIPPSQTPPPDGVLDLTVEEVVQKFGVTKAWLYRNKKHLPHSQPSRKVLLFPEQSLTRWFATRKP